MDKKSLPWGATAIRMAGTDAQRTHFLATEVGDLCVLELLDSEGVLMPRAVDQPYLDGKDLLPDLTAINDPAPSGTASTIVMGRGEPLRITDPSGNDPLELVRKEFHPFLRRYHVHSLLVVPMLSRGRVTGAITMAKGSASKAYTQEDQGTIQSLADRAALALANAQLFAENITQAEALKLANHELEERVSQRTQELAQANERLQRLAVEDALTGLANRRRFNEAMDEEIRRMRRTNGILSLLLCDVDFFKRYNDRYGHSSGDECLRTVGEVMRSVFKRAGELPARYGGEEFAVVLPGVNSSHARRAAERLRLALEEIALPHLDSDAADHVTLSIGVITAKVDTESDATWFIERADEALYRSKHEGRNRVTTVNQS